MCKLTCLGRVNFKGASEKNILNQIDYCLILKIYRSDTLTAVNESSTNTKIRSKTGANNTNIGFNFHCWVNGHVRLELMKHCRGSGL